MTATTLPRLKAPPGERLLAAAALFGLGFQFVHVVEHVAQTVYWGMHPTAAPWLTPWAAAGRDALAMTVDGHPGSGNELLHLAGNMIFLAGLAALIALLQRGNSPVPRPLRAARWIQGLHVLEHAVLTATWFVFGQALGLTTLFGAVEGATLGGLRVWAHFALNLVATVYAIGGVMSLVLRRPRT